MVNAFNASRTFAFPPSGFTLRWWADAWNSDGMWTSLANSVLVGLGATAVALVLGTMIAFAVQRHQFFGRNTISFLNATSHVNIDYYDQRLAEPVNPVSVFRAKLDPWLAEQCEEAGVMVMPTK